MQALPEGGGALGEAAEWGWEGPFLFLAPDYSLHSSDQTPLPAKAPYPPHIPGMVRWRFRWVRKQREIPAKKTCGLK